MVLDIAPSLAGQLGSGGKNLDVAAPLAGNTVEAARKTAKRAVKTSSAETNFEEPIASAALNRTADSAGSAA